MSCADDDNKEEFAGFSRAEWRAAMTRTLGKRGADRWVQALFTRLAQSPSNGHALDAETWAHLALVSRRCDERVTAATMGYPEAFLKLIEEEKLVALRKGQGGFSRRCRDLWCRLLARG